MYALVQLPLLILRAQTLPSRPTFRKLLLRQTMAYFDWWISKMKGESCLSEANGATSLLLR